MDEINPLSKFLSPLISLICGEDTISVPGIACGSIWGSFPVFGLFVVQFGDHLRAGIIYSNPPGPRVFRTLPW